MDEGIGLDLVVILIGGLRLGDLNGVGGNLLTVLDRNDRMVF